MRFDKNNLILGIDTGEKTHGIVVFNTHCNVVVYSNPEASTKEVYDITGRFRAIVIEDVDAVHGNIGLSTVETIKQIGRFHHHFLTNGYMVHLIGRSEIKKKIKCKDDTQVRAYLKEKYGNTIIKQLKSHCLSALAIIDVYEQL